MRKPFFAMLAMAAGMAMTGLTAVPANALPVAKSAVSTKSDIVNVRRDGGGFGMHRGGGRGFGMHRGGGRNFYGGGVRRGWGGGGWRHHRGTRIIIGPSYGYGYGYGNRCHWLKRKAIISSSRYWWRRYNQCRYY